MLFYTLNVQPQAPGARESSVTPNLERVIRQGVVSPLDVVSTVVEVLNFIIWKRESNVFPGKDDPPSTPQLTLDFLQERHGLEMAVLEGGAGASATLRVGMARLALPLDVTTMKHKR